MMRTDVGIRVALREITETAYRALRVIGASHGEAQATADAVQFAEARDGRGICALASDIEEGRWHASGLDAVTHTREGAPVVAVEPGARRGVTAVGPMLIELAAGRGELVVYPSVLGVSSVLDLPLLRNADASGAAIVIAEQEESQGYVCIATPSGLLGHGMVPTTVSTLLPHLAPGRTCVAPMPSIPETLSQSMAWESLADRDQRRRRVAHDGLIVDPEAWRYLREVARGYLQPDIT